MVLLALALAFTRPVAPDFDALARARDAEGLLAISGPRVKALDRPFNFLKLNGPYGTGRFGWTAVPLNALSGEKYIVFSTKITSQDYGEFVFTTDGSTITGFVSESNALGHRIEHQKLDIRFEPAAKKVAIRSTATFRRSGAAPGGFLIRMSPHYRVSSVRNQEGVTVPFVQAGGVVWLKSQPRDRFAYTIAYGGVVDLAQYAGSISTREALLTNDYWYPMIARLPQTYEATIRTQKDWIAIAQGEQVAETTSGDERATTWKMDLPAVYWSLSAGPFRSVKSTIRGRNYRVWSFRMSEEAMRMHNELSAPIIEWFDANLAPYPFSTWGAVDSPAYGGGALEAYSFATYGGGLPAEDGHETGHTWFGGIIANTYLISLWNESFAVYVDALVSREMGIGNRAERRFAFVDEATPDPSYARMPMSDSGVFRGPVGASLGYGKGAKVLQMLEIELGTEGMIAAMRDWLKSHPKGTPGEWEHFEKAAEKSSGRSLKTFFDEWVRRPGWAEFGIENVRWEGGRVTGEAVFRGHPYHLLTEVMLQSAAGVRKFAAVRFVPEGNRAKFAIDSPEKPALVSFDPWRKLLHNANPNERSPELNRLLSGMKRYNDPARPGWLQNVRAGSALTELPASLDGVFLVGSPETLPAMKPLCDRVGFRVEGNKLTYDGTTIDLTKGSALALVDLPEGGRCAIGLGTTRRRPSPGRARLVLTDDLGRFLRGVTEPKTGGFLTFRL